MKLCACGCGKPTNICKVTDKRRGIKKGEYRTYIQGHQIVLINQLRNKEDKCYVCGIDLIENNWIPSCKRKRDRICRACHNLQSSLWRLSHLKQSNSIARKSTTNYRKTHPNEVLAYRREYARYHILNTIHNGKPLQLNGITKRHKSESCELCGNHFRLAYHHWDIKDKIVYGMWICRFCHIFATRLDRGLFPIYLRMKDSITTELDAQLATTNLLSNK